MIERKQDGQILTVDDLVTRWGGVVSRKVIYRLQARHQGPKGFRVGRRLLFLALEVEAWERRGGSRWLRLPSTGT